MGKVATAAGGIGGGGQGGVPVSGSETRALSEPFRSGGEVAIGGAGQGTNRAS